jgi:hypothetical protein
MTDELTTEPENDEEAMEMCQDMQGDLNDVVIQIDGKDPVKALDVLEEVETKVEVLTAFLKGLIESQKPNG